MSELQKDIKKNAIAWLERFSQELECDPDIINLMPIDEIRESLRASGADVEGFHVKITEMLLRSKAENLLPKLKTWLSLPWKPQWAGEVVTAADIGPQEETFKMDYGQYINISCYWQGEDSSSSAFIHLKWNANILFSSNLWAWFVDPDTHETLFKDCLGSDLEGKKNFYEQELGFNPCARKWAISVFVEKL
ncbi:hypothetical protein [Desulfonema magnum]|uniref:Uncharacterized protein n=1 Tax=Desulfonema magnum TaxID=45655 RepID=A0A975BEV0_9BACT|nr:hypothetical protein [Desulfonema magnum]QTA84424.1 Uncharacterized protein dnm_004200 [Desulfonema magnum]